MDPWVVVANPNSSPDENQTAIEKALKFYGMCELRSAFSDAKNKLVRNIPILGDIRVPKKATIFSRNKARLVVTRDNTRGLIMTDGKGFFFDQTLQGFDVTYKRQQTEAHPRSTAILGTDSVGLCYNLKIDGVRVSKCYDGFQNSAHAKGVSFYVQMPRFNVTKHTGMGVNWWWWNNANKEDKTSRIAGGTTNLLMGAVWVADSRGGNGIWVYGCNNVQGTGVGCDNVKGGSIINVKLCNSGKLACFVEHCEIHLGKGKGGTSAVRIDGGCVDVDAYLVRNKIHAHDKSAIALVRSTNNAGNVRLSRSRDNENVVGKLPNEIVE